MKDGGKFGASVAVFEDWDIFGSPDYDNYKGRAYLYRIYSGSCKYHQALQTRNGSDSDVLVEMWQFMGKPWLSEYLLIIMAMLFLKGTRTFLHCRDKHGKTMTN